MSFARRRLNGTFLPAHNWSSGAAKVRKVGLRRFSSALGAGQDSARYARLTDTLGRRHTYLRISLTERCSLRCQYCMPAEGVELQPQADMLSADEVVLLAKLFVQAGVSKIRLTGGEPLLRPDIVDICNRLRGISGLKDVGITTNGLVLQRMLPDLQRAGVNQLNISLDTLIKEKFEFITRRKGLERVMAAIAAAIDAGFAPVKVNVCVMNGFNEDELVDMVAWTKETPVDVRFIEWMPFHGNAWNDKKFISYDTMLSIIHAAHPDLKRHHDGPNDTAKHWRLPGGAGRVGFITSMSEHFCGTCNRLRITADGNLKVCLFDNGEVSLRDAVRSGMSEESLYNVIEAAVKLKKPSLGGVASMYDLAASPNRSMILIGG